MSDDSSEGIDDFHHELVEVMTALTRIASRVHLLQGADDPALAVLLNRSNVVLERLSTAEAMLEPIRLQ